MRHAWVVGALAGLCLGLGCSADRGGERGTGPRGAVDAGRDAGRTGWDGGPPPPPRPIPDAGPVEGCTDVVDLVFVLDVSSSMGFVLDTLDAQIGEVVTAATELAPDPHFGIVAFVDNERLDDRGALEGGLVHTEASTLQGAFRDFQSTYTNPNRNPGDGPGGPTTQNPICEENSLDALHTAASQFPWRENATRVIIHVTDDTFIEAPDNYGDRDGDGRTDRADFPREGDYPAVRTMAETVDLLKSERIRVFAFTRLSPPGPFDLLGRCGTPRRLDWEQVSAGWSTPYMGMTPIPEATDAANFDLDAVRDGDLSLVETINEVVVDSYCDPPLI